MRGTRKIVQKELKDERFHLTLNYLFNKTDLKPPIKDYFNKTDLRPLIKDHLLSSASYHGM